jgi:hypothetical protein
MIHAAFIVFSLNSMLPNQHLDQHSPAQRRKQCYRHGNHTP